MLLTQALRTAMVLMMLSHFMAEQQIPHLPNRGNATGVLYSYQVKIFSYVALLGFWCTIAPGISSNSPTEADRESVSLHTWGQILISILGLIISENEQTFGYGSSIKPKEIIPK